jgi:DNA-binding MarR family transcriptional regulator
MTSSVDPFSQPGHVIRRLQQIAVQAFHEETAAFDLTPTQYVSLLVIGTKPGIDQVRMSERTMIDRSMTARIVETLAQRGLIRKQTGKTDKRANALHATQKGMRLLEAVEPSLEKSQARILSPLSPPERKEFMRMVGVILAAHERNTTRPARKKAD